MDLQNLKGIGPKQSSLFHKLNIDTVEDLINYYPFRYDELKITPLQDANISKNICVVATILNDAKISYIKRNFNRMMFQAEVENKIIRVSIFNRAFMKQHLHIGRKVILVGSYDEKKNILTASNIVFDLFSSSQITPIYHKVAGITDKKMQNYILEGLKLPLEIDDYIPSYLVSQYEFLPKKEALSLIHEPKDLSMLKKARLRLIYEELFWFMFQVNYLSYQRKEHNLGLKRDVDFHKIEEFLMTLPFALTKDQKKALEEICHDLLSPQRMNRILLGDVGSGKTIVAMLGLYFNYLSGYQGAFMAPTELLAIQHAKVMEDFFGHTEIRVKLLLGSMSKREKDGVIEGLKEGTVDIVIGTHALLSEHVIFSNLGFVVTDEQHRFGVNQRGNLQNKGLKPDILYLSATPIPRTYALMLYGDMDTSIIKTKPNGRKEIITKVKGEKELKEVLEHILNEIKLGHQVYVVAPLIEGDENSQLYDVYELQEKFDMAFGHKIPIRLLHGKMKKQEKDAVMKDFQSGCIPILISTTVIEVGIDVKSATMMVIFHADHFGLATLHQLRGRVGRSDLQSYCYLICNHNTPRLKVMEESNDGFYISEKDFLLRGSGDLFGVEQSGDMTFQIADIKRDVKILEQAKKDSEVFLKQNISSQFAGIPIYQNLWKKFDMID